MNNLEAKLPFLIALFFMGFSIGSCTQKPEKTTQKALLDALSFSEQLKNNPDAPILDVRTPGEFASGHLKNAVNLDWNGNDFEKHAALLDKSQPVFVYCKSGGRSEAAVTFLQKSGFTQVFELKGGIMKWEAAELPVENVQHSTGGMSLEQFKTQIDSGKVLVNFFAAWCIPCRKMEPFLQELEAAYQESIPFLHLDVDANRALLKSLEISGVPVLQLYHNGELIWSHTGFIAKEDLVQQLQ